MNRIIFITGMGSTALETAIFAAEIMEQFGKDVVIDFFHKEDAHDAIVPSLTSFEPIPNSIAIVIHHSCTFSRLVKSWQRVKRELSNCIEDFYYFENALENKNLPISITKNFKNYGELKQKFAFAA